MRSGIGTKMKEKQNAFGENVVISKRFSVSKMECDGTTMYTFFIDNKIIPWHFKLPHYLCTVHTLDSNVKLYSITSAE